MKLAFDDWVLDLDTRELLSGGHAVPIPPKAFALLELLARRRPKAVSKNEIHRALWPDTFVSEANLANLVAELRAVLGDDAHAPRIIRTVHRFGYAFCADARREASEPGSTAEASVDYRIILRRREISLDPGSNLLGRSRDATAWINHESVSRRHARILVTEEGAVIEDLGSKNGTLLNGRRLASPASLRDGDEILLGEVSLRFHVFRADASTRTGERKLNHKPAD